MTKVVLKTPIFSQQVVEDCRARPLYDDASVRELFVRVGPPPKAAEMADAAAVVLSEIAYRFADAAWREEQSSPKAIAKRAEEISEKAGELLSLAGIPTDKSGNPQEPSPTNIHPHLGQGGLYATAAGRGEPSGQAATINALRAVYFLRQDAAALADIMARRRTRSGGRPRIESIRSLLSELAYLYRQTWHLEASYSRDGGPFNRLVGQVAAALKARGVRFSGSVESFYSAWKSLSEEDKCRDLPIQRFADLTEAEKRQVEEALTNPTAAK